MNNIGKGCYITAKESFYHDEWGIIKHFDGEYYHIAIRNDQNCCPIFTRNEIRIPKKQPKHWFYGKEEKQ